MNQDINLLQDDITIHNEEEKYVQALANLGQRNVHETHGIVYQSFTFKDCFENKKIETENQIGYIKYFNNNNGNFCQFGIIGINENDMPEQIIIEGNDENVIKYNYKNIHRYYFLPENIIINIDDNNYIISENSIIQYNDSYYRTLLFIKNSLNEINEIIYNEFSSSNNLLEYSIRLYKENQVYRDQTYNALKLENNQLKLYNIDNNIFNNTYALNDDLLTILNANLNGNEIPLEGGQIYIELLINTETNVLLSIEDNYELNKIIGNINNEISYIYPRLIQEYDKYFTQNIHQLYRQIFLSIYDKCLNIHPDILEEDTVLYVPLDLKIFYYGNYENIFNIYNLNNLFINIIDLEEYRLNENYDRNILNSICFSSDEILINKCLNLNINICYHELYNDLIYNIDTIVNYNLPYIDPVSYNWIINNENSGISSSLNKYNNQYVIIIYSDDSLDQGCQILNNIPNAVESLFNGYIEKDININTKYLYGDNLAYLSDLYIGKCYIPNIKNNDDITKSILSNSFVISILSSSNIYSCKNNKEINDEHIKDNLVFISMFKYNEEKNEYITITDPLEDNEEAIGLSKIFDLNTYTSSNSSINSYSTLNDEYKSINIGNYIIKSFKLNTYGELTNKNKIDDFNLSDIITNENYDESSNIYYDLKINYENKIYYGLNLHKCLNKNLYNDLFSNYDNDIINSNYIFAKITKLYIPQSITINNITYTRYYDNTDNVEDGKIRTFINYENITYYVDADIQLTLNLSEFIIINGITYYTELPDQPGENYKLVSIQIGNETGELSTYYTWEEIEYEVNSPDTIEFNNITYYKEQQDKPEGAYVSISYYSQEYSTMYYAWSPEEENRPTKIINTDNTKKDIYIFIEENYIKQIANIVIDNQTSANIIDSKLDIELLCIEGTDKNNKGKKYTINVK